MRSHPPRAPIVILLGTLGLLLASAIGFGLPQVRRAAELGRVARAQAQLAGFAAACEAHRTAFGSVPGGTPAEIVDSLAGNNARRMAFLALAPGMTNGRGEPIDPWGTPWMLTNVGGHKLEARAAGPNRNFGDDDDLTSAQPSAALPGPLRQP